MSDISPALLEGADLTLDGGELPGTASTVLDLREYERHAALAHRARGPYRAGWVGAGSGRLAQWDSGAVEVLEVFEILRPAGGALHRTEVLQTAYANLGIPELYGEGLRREFVVRKV